MARLQFCDYHNMVAILEKGEHNADFHLMVDFIEASPLMYALTIKPTVYVSHIRQFWSTARIETTEEGTKILASMDVLFHTRKLFTTLRVNSPSISGRIIPLFVSMLVQQGEGSGTPFEPHHTPSPGAQSQSHTTHSSPTLPPVTTTFIPNVTPSDTPIVRKYTRRTRISQSSIPPIVADEPASPLRDVSQGEACPTDSSFIADQDRATIDNSSTLPLDSAPWVTSLIADEGKLTAKFLAQEVKINRLKERVKLLEDREGVAVTRFRYDAPIKGRTTVLASEVVDVPTGSGSIPTANTLIEVDVPTGSDVVPTASLVFATTTMVTPYRRRKGKEVMVESETPKKQKVQEQIDAHVARELEEQLERGSEKFALDLPIKRTIELITDLVKYQYNYAKIYKFQSQQRKPWTKKQNLNQLWRLLKETLSNRPPTSKKEMDIWVELNRLYEPDDEDQL
nr:hypothetical protein [Tanacetum cinerariifolium]